MFPFRVPENAQANKIQDCGTDCSRRSIGALQTGKYRGIGPSDGRLLPSSPAAREEPAGTCGGEMLGEAQEAEKQTQLRTQLVLVATEHSPGMLALAPCGDKSGADRQVTPIFRADHPHSSAPGSKESLMRQSRYSCRSSMSTGGKRCAWNTRLRR